MKIDFSETIKDLKGRPIVDGEIQMTLGGAVSGALLASFPDERDLDGKEKVKRFKLALLVADGGEQDISIEDAALLQRIIAKAFGPLVVGRAYEIIEAANGKGHGKGK